MKLAIFDFDGTLLMSDTLPALAREWNRQKRPRSRYIRAYVSIFPLVFLYKLGLLSRERMKYLAVVKFNRLFRKMSQEEVRRFFTDAYQGMGGLFNPQVLEELESLKSQGYRCILLSGAYIELLRVVAEDLGFETVIGTELAFRDGVFDHRKEPEVVDGQGKLELLKRAVAWDSVDWESSRSYGDSFSDLVVMEIVGEPVAVNPDPRLLAYARDRSWRVIEV